MASVGGSRKRLVLVGSRTEELSSYFGFWDGLEGARVVMEGLWFDNHWIESVGGDG